MRGLAAKLRLLALFVVGCISVCPSPGLGASGASGNRYALVVLGTTPYESARSIIEKLEPLGFRTVIILPPRVLIGRMVAGRAADIRKNATRLCVEEVIDEKVSDVSRFSRYGEEVVEDLQTWNAAFAPGGMLDASSMRKRMGKAPGLPLGKDTRALPEVDPALTATRYHVGGSPPFGSAPVDTSEYMIGNRVKANGGRTIAVNMIFPESAGLSENWTLAERIAARSSLVAACGWWEAVAPACANVRFLCDRFCRNYSGTCPRLSTVVVSGEPIQLSSTVFGFTWVNEIMDSYGYSTFGGPQNWASKVVVCADDLRTKWDADWAFNVFAVRDMNDPDGMFPDGQASFSVLGGPCMVVLMQNGIKDQFGNLIAMYSPAYLDYVCAHEIGHIFYALDEYATGISTKDAESGYLKIRNDNHVDWGLGVDCIMRCSTTAYLTGGVCTPTREMLGWRDTDGDGIFDILDVPPLAVFDIHYPEPEFSPTPFLTGTAQVGLLPNLNPQPRSFRHAINVDNLAGVAYTANGTPPWGNASVADGAWDGGVEAFGFTTPALSCGINTIQAKPGVNPCDSLVLEQSAPYSSFTLERACPTSGTMLDTCDMALTCTQPSDQWGMALDVAVDYSASVFYVVGQKGGADWTDNNAHWYVERYRIDGDTCALDPSWGDNYSPPDPSWAEAVAVDAWGNVYIAGRRVELANGINVGRMVVRKYNSAGVLLAQQEMTPSATWYATGNVRDVAVDAVGNVIVVGSEVDFVQKDFPYAPRWHVAVFDSGLAVANTWLEDHGILSEAAGVVTDNAGSFYVCGTYVSLRNPLGPLNGQTIGYCRVAKYALGSSQPLAELSLTGSGNAIARKSNGDLIVTGAAGEPVQPDLRLLQLTPSLELVWTGFGGWGYPLSVAVDRCDRIGVVGHIGDPPHRDWLIERFAPSGLRITRITTGGPTNWEDWARGAAFDQAGGMIVVGWDADNGLLPAHWRVKRYQTRTDLSLACILTPTEHLKPGDTISLVAAAANRGTSMIPDAISDITTTGPVTLVSGPGPTPVPLAPGTTTEFVWTYQIDSFGLIAFSVSVTGLTPSLCECVTGFVVASCGSSVAVSPAVVTPPEEWPQFHHDGAHTGLADALTCPWMELKWSRTLSIRKKADEFSFASPIVAAGKVFAGAMDGRLLACDAVTGAPVWAYPVGANPIQSAAAAVSFTDGLTVVVVGTSTGLAGIDAGTGTLLWTATLTGGINRGSPTMVGGLVYAASVGGVAAGVDARTGAILWSNALLGLGVDCSPAYGNGSLFILRSGANNTDVLKLDAVSGVIQGILSLTDGPTSSSPTYAQGRVFFGCDKGVFYVVDAASMSLVCSPSFKVPNPPIVFSTPAVSGSSIYVGAADPAMKNADGGIWTFDDGMAPPCTMTHIYPSVDGADVYSSPALGWDDEVFFGADRLKKVSGANLLGIDRAGSSMFGFAVPAGFTARGSPAIANEMVYYTATTGTKAKSGVLVLYAFGPVPFRPPFALTAVPDPTDCNVKLCWQMGTQSCPLPTTMRVFRSTMPGFDVNAPSTDLVADLPPLAATCFTDTSVTAGITYYYRVCTSQATWGPPMVLPFNWFCSNEIAVTMQPVLAPPVIIGIGSGTTLTATVIWDAPNVPCHDECTRYIIFRSTVPGQRGILVGSVVGSVSMFADPDPIPGEVNCYIAVCENIAGTVSADSTPFCTRIPPKCPGGFLIGIVPFQLCEVDLCWDAARCPHNVTGYRLYRATYSGVPMDVPIVEVGTPGTTCYMDRDVTAGHTYYYRVCAVIPTGENVGCADEIAITVIQTTTPPSLNPPELLPGGKVDLSWGAPDPMCALGCTNYVIYRSSIPGRRGDEVGLFSSTATNFIDTPPVVAGTFYCYSVICLDDKATPDRVSNQECIYVVPTPPPCPGWFTALPGIGGLCDIKLCWNAANCGPGVTGFVVYRATFSGVPQINPILTGPVTLSTCYTDSDVTPGVPYYYRICYVHDDGSYEGCTDEVWTSIVAKVVLPPTIGLVRRQANGSVYVSWSPPRTGECIESCSTYAIFRSTGTWWPDDEMVRVGGGTTFYVDTPPNLPGVMYCYGVACVSAGEEESPRSNGICLAPPCPTGLTAVAVGGEFCGVGLCWAGGTFCAQPVTAFVIYRNTYPGVQLSDPITGTTIVSSGCYTDYAASAGVRYYYRVCALTDGSTTAWCADEIDLEMEGVQVAPNLEDVKILPDGGLQLIWSPPELRCGVPCTVYAIYRATAGTVPYLIALIDPSTSTWVDTNPVPGETNCYGMCCALTGTPCPVRVCAYPALPCIPVNAPWWAEVGHDADASRGIPIPGPINANFATIFTASGVIAGPVTTAEGYIVFGDLAGIFYVLNPDFSVRCEYQTGGAIRFAPAVDVYAKRIVVGSDDGYLYQFDYDCNLKATLHVGRLRSPVIVDCGRGRGWLGDTEGGVIRICSDFSCSTVIAPVRECRNCAGGGGGGGGPAGGDSNIGRILPIYGGVLRRWCDSHNCYIESWGEEGLRGSFTITGGKEGQGGWMTIVRPGSGTTFMITPGPGCVLAINLPSFQLKWILPIASGPPAVDGCRIFLWRDSIVTEVDCEGIVQREIPCGPRIRAPIVASGTLIYVPQDGGFSIIGADRTFVPFNWKNPSAPIMAWVPWFDWWWLMWCVPDGENLIGIWRFPGWPQLPQAQMGFGSIELSWLVPPFSSSPFPLGSFAIQRGAFPGDPNGVFLPTLPASQTSFTDNDVLPGMTYCYTLYAIDTEGNIGPPAVSVCAGPVPTAVGLTATFEVAPAAVCAAGSTVVSLTVSNVGRGVAVDVSPANPAITGAGGVALVDGPFPTPPRALTAGGSVVFTWTYTATTLGSVVFSTTATGRDAMSGRALTTGTVISSQLSVQTPGLLVSQLALPSQVGVGQVFGVSLTVTNVGGAVASGVTPAIQLTSGAGLVEGPSGPSPSGPRDVLPGATATFAWSYTAVGTGTICFSVTASGLTCGTTAVASVASGCAVVAMSSVAGLKIAAPSTVTSSVIFTLTVTALDASGRPASSYVGTVLLTSSDPLASLPASIAFTSADAGVKVVQVTLQTPGIVTIEVMDAVTIGVRGEASVEVLCPATGESLLVSVPALVYPGVDFTMTVTALNARGKVDTRFTGTVAFSSSDSMAVLPGPCTFSRTDSGARLFTVQFYSPGAQQIVASDGSGSCGFSGSSLVTVDADSNVVMLPNAYYNDIDFFGTEGWIVGALPGDDAPLVLHHDGRAWSRVRVPHVLSCTGYFGTAVSLSSSRTGWMSADVYHGGCVDDISRNTLYRLVDGNWTIAETTEGMAYASKGIRLVSETEGWHAALDCPTCDLALADTRIYHFDGTTWSIFQHYPGVNIGMSKPRFVRGQPNEGWLLGDLHPYHFDGTQWTMDPTAPQLRGFWMNARDDVWGGARSSNQLWHFDGSSWVAVSSPAPDPQSLLLGVSFLDSEHGIAVGGTAGQGATNLPVVIVYACGTWTSVPVSPPNGFRRMVLEDVRMVSPTKAWAIGEVSTRPMGSLTQGVVIGLDLPDISGGGCGVVFGKGEGVRPAVHTADGRMPIASIEGPRSVARGRATGAQPVVLRTKFLGAGAGFARECRPPAPQGRVPAGASGASGHEPEKAERHVDRRPDPDLMPTARIL